MKSLKNPIVNLNKIKFFNSKSSPKTQKKHENSKNSITSKSSKSYSNTSKSDDSELSRVISEKNINEKEDITIIPLKNKNKLISLKKQKTEDEILEQFFSLIKKKHIKVIEYKALTFSKTDIIGEGGLGIVYRGLYKNSEVAIKKYNYNIYANFYEDKTKYILEEISKSLTIDIPKANKCYGFSYDDNGAVYSIHELALRSLKEKLKEKLNLEEKNFITKQILYILILLSHQKIIIVHIGICICVQAINNNKLLILFH